MLGLKEKIPWYIVREENKKEVYGNNSGGG